MPGTTPIPNRYPYPLGTDLVVDGDNAIRALAEAVDLRTKDTGWVPITAFLNSFSAAAGGVAYRCRNGVMSLSGQLYRATAPTTQVAAFLIPSQYLPRNLVGIAVYSAWGLNVQVPTNGNVMVEATQARSSGTGYMLDGVTWLVRGEDVIH